jgi:hypothetical protein
MPRPSFSLLPRSHELPRTVLTKLSEKGYERCSYRGFGRCTEAKVERKPLLGGPQGYDLDTSRAFRTVS